MCHSENSTDFISLTGNSLQKGALQNTLITPFQLAATHNTRDDRAE